MLSAADSLMWDALEIGPQWILRETEDVTLAETALRAELRQPAPAVRSAAPAAPSRPARRTIHRTAAGNASRVRAPSRTRETRPRRSSRRRTDFKRPAGARTRASARSCRRL